MPTSLEEIGEPVLGSGFKLNLQVARGGLTDRTVSRTFKVRVEDVPYYTVDLLNPTLYDLKYPQAVLVDQDFKDVQPNKVDGHLVRTFSEKPSEWNDSFDRTVTFPGVALSALYAPGDFAFRPSQITLPTDVRVNRVYFITADEDSIPRYPLFKVFDSSGLQTSVITDFTSPSCDDWIGLVAGLQEIVTQCRVERWRGPIFCRETLFAKAQ